MDCRYAKLAFYTNKYVWWCTCDVMITFDILILYGRIFFIPFMYDKNLIYKQHSLPPND